MRVYHLSPSTFALSNVALRRLKIARFADLNDPFELLGADLANRFEREAFRRTKEQTDRDIGLLCFSRSWHNPVLWSHYADKHRGICLGFDVADHLVKPVTYVDRPTKVPVTGKGDQTNIPEQFFGDLLGTKFQDWRYEDEVRLFVKLDKKTEEGGLYFIPFSAGLQLREVILGPRCRLPLSSIRALVASYAPSVYVLQSRLAFKTFKVVEHRGATRGNSKRSESGSEA